MKITIIHQKDGREIEAEIEIDNEHELIVTHNEPSQTLGSDLDQSISLRIVRAYLTQRQNLVLIVTG